MDENDIREDLRHAAAKAPAWSEVPAAAIDRARHRTRRHRGILAGGVAAACIVGVGGWRLTTNDSASVPAGPVPGPATSVLDTANAYVQAAAAGDCAMTKALESPKLQSPVDWCHGDPKLKRYEITHAVEAENPPLTAVREECVPMLVTNSANSEHSMEAGTTPWSFCFIKTAAGWRLYDQGAG